MKALAIILLLAASCASADTIDVFDHALQLQSHFTSCSWIAYEAKAECGARVDVPDKEPAPEVGGFGQTLLSVTYGCNVAEWDVCYLTQVQGIGPGETYFRYDCAVDDHGEIELPALRLK